MGGKLFVVSGPSGVGKDTVLTNFFSEINNTINLEYSISATTRNPRADEEDGKDYYFMDKNDFLKKKEKGEFLETACVHNNLYGTPKKHVEKCLKNDKNLIIEVDIQGAKQIKNKFPDAILIFLIPPSFKELKKRLNKRNSESKKNKNIRLKNAKKELKEKIHFDYQIVNDDINETVVKLEKIIKEEISN